MTTWRLGWREKRHKRISHIVFYDSRSLKLHISSSYTTSTTPKNDDDDTNWRNSTLTRRAVMWSNIQILIHPGRDLISSFFPINFISWKLMYRNWYTPKSSSSVNHSKKEHKIKPVFKRSNNSEPKTTRRTRLRISLCNELWKSRWLTPDRVCDSAKRELERNEEHKKPRTTLSRTLHNKKPVPEIHKSE